MSFEETIDGLHAQLDADPTNETAFFALAKLYQEEGALEELTELYLNQIEVSQHRVPAPFRERLFVDFAILLEQQYEQPAEALIVLTDALKELPTSLTVLRHLRPLSNSIGDGSAFLNAVANCIQKRLDHDVNEFVIDCWQELTSQLRESYRSELQNHCIDEGSSHLMTAFWRGCSTGAVDETNLNLRARLSVSVALNECPTDPSLAEHLQYCPADLILPLCALMGHHSDPVNVAEMWKGILGALNDADESVRQTALNACLEFAISQQHQDLLQLIGQRLNQLDSSTFELIVSQLKIWLSSNSHQHIASAFLQTRPYWLSEQQIVINRLVEMQSIERASPIEALAKIKQSATLSEEEKREWQETAVLEFIKSVTEHNFSEFGEAISTLPRADQEKYMEACFVRHHEKMALRDSICDWYLKSSADLRVLDNFIDVLARHATDFDHVASFIKARAKKGMELGESAARTMSLQQRALQLSPSETGLYDYFKPPRRLDEEEFEFISRFALNEDVDPRIGFAILVHGFEMDESLELDQAWRDIFARASARLTGYGIYQQKLVRILTQRGYIQEAANLLRVSAKREPNTELKGALLLDAGDLLLAAHPKDAAKSFYEAFKLSDADRTILSKLLDAYQRAEAWSSSVKVLRKLASLEPAPAVKAKYLYAMGVIHRDKLEDHVTAVRAFDRALDADPSMLKAIQAIDEVITNSRDYARQDRYYRKNLNRLLENDGDPRVILMLAKNLAQLNHSKLNNPNDAIQALLVAKQYSEDAREVNEHLYVLYRETKNLEAALRIHYHCLNENPLKVRHYRDLLTTLKSFGFEDSARRVSRTLVALGEPETAPPKDTRHSRTLEVRHFSKALWHLIEPVDYDTVYNQALDIIAEPIRSVYALADDAYRFSRPEPLGKSSVPPIFMEVVSRLRIALPNVWFSSESAPIALVHRRKMALVVGPGIDILSPVEQKFLATRMLIFTKPEYFLATHPSTLQERVGHLTEIFNGCITVTNSGKAPKKASPLVKKVLSKLTDKDILALTQLLSRETKRNEAQTLKWLQDTERMLNRAGFVVTDQLEVATRLTREMPITHSELSVEAQLTDLLSFSVSAGFLGAQADLVIK